MRHERVVKVEDIDQKSLRNRYFPDFKDRGERYPINYEQDPISACALRSLRLGMYEVAPGNPSKRKNLGTGERTSFILCITRYEMIKENYKSEFASDGERRPHPERKDFCLFHARSS